MTSTTVSWTCLTVALATLLAEIRWDLPFWAELIIIVCVLVATAATSRGEEADVRHLR